MPIYEYQCDRCCTRFEIRKSITEVTDSVNCPVCDFKETHRCWSAPNITKISTPNQRTLPSYNRPVPLFNGITMEDVTIENCGTGIHVENANIRGKKVKLRGNKKGLVARHSKVEIEGLEIE